jgi:PIN domain nuclease of toxin-antitoxin system
MRLLLDTHTLIWFFAGDAKLSNIVRNLIEDENNEKLLSTASVWEMAIKQSKGKLYLTLPLKDYIKQKLGLNNFKLLVIDLEHLNIIATLPFHYSDPFDRLIIAQAMVEKIPVLSRDGMFDAYPINRIW